MSSAGVSGLPGPVVASAQHRVGDLVLGCLVEPGVPDDDLPPLRHHAAADGPRVVGGPGAAPAQRLDLHDPDLVGQLDQAERAGEQARAEVGGDPEGEHVDAQLVHDRGELLDLVGRQELRLVADHIVDLRVAGQLAAGVREQIRVLDHLDGLGRQAEPAGEHAAAGPVVAGEDEAAPSARGAVVVHLQGERRLAAVHRPGEEDQ
jgi:hypothetical protein